MRTKLKTRTIEIFGANRQLVQFLGKSDDWFSKMIHGMRDPTPDEQKKICKLLKVPLSEADELFKKQDIKFLK